MSGYALGSVEPVTFELIAPAGDRPAVKVTFNAQPTPLSLRAGAAAVAKIMREGGPNAVERAGDAYSAALIRHNLLSWEGIGGLDDQVVEPTHDTEKVDDDGKVIGIIPGTISLFIAEPRLFEAADRLYVLPWAQLDAEKNGYAPSQNGTSAGATPEHNTAGSPAKRRGTGGARPIRKRAKKPARTKSTPAVRTTAKHSGS